MFRSSKSLMIIVVVSLGITWGYMAFSQREEMGITGRYTGRHDAPEFPSGMEWLNTDRPLTIRDLRGKVVMLDFWTYCCINCMHILPDLKKLERKYADELVVIGVHSAKFTTEQETENIRQAILRYEIEHPVVNDRDLNIWRQYGVGAWPTAVLINPQGKIVTSRSGEGVFSSFDPLIAEVISEFDSKGLIDRRSLKLTLERDGEPKSLLSFPGKVLADETTGKLYISDSNHNRIVVAFLDDGTVLEVVGSGRIGLLDGGFEEAAFNHPQGMALRGEILYVADTENHAIRQVDLAARKVTTIAGSGEQAAFGSDGGVGTSVRLNSPWDLVVAGDKLYIAMAGPHQLWVMDLTSQRVEVYAGSGREARIDGTLRQAALAQPSGLTTDGKTLYFADSEVSSIRSADLPPGDAVLTIVGLDLFEFGDRDGQGDRVRLQHPLGVAFYDGYLYVADTYNNKIKRIHPQKRTSETLFGTGEAGRQDGDDPLFDEPGGLTAANGKLYIADTNNHLIRVADLETKTVATFQFKGMQKLKSGIVELPLAPEPIAFSTQRLKPGDGTLNLSLDLPRGYKLNPQGPTKVILRAHADGAIGFQDGRDNVTVNPSHFPISVPLQLREGEGEIMAEIYIYYCKGDEESLCYYQEARLSVPVEIRDGASESTISITQKVEAGN